MGYYRYWGKAAKNSDDHHLLVYHCLDVAAVASAMLSVRRFWVDKETPVSDPLLRKAVSELKKTWPGKPEFYLVVPLREVGGIFV